MTKFAMTTQGRVAAEELGFVLPHEHLFFDLAAFWTEPGSAYERSVASAGLVLDTAAELRRSPMLVQENLVFWDEEVSVRELGYFLEAGGSTIVDCTLPEMKRNVEAAARVARASGVKVVVTTGHYEQHMHAPEIARQSVDDITRWMVHELRDGIDGTDIRAGIIKIGVTTVPNMHPDELKCLQAAGQAQAETGAPITIHNPIPFQKRGMEVIRILTGAGAAPERIIMGHMTQTVPDIFYHRRIMDTGATAEFDRFGEELYMETWPAANRWGLYAGEPRDSDVVREIAELVRDGYVDRILLSHDIGTRNAFRTYGGFGYAHIPRRIASYLSRSGVDDRDVRQLTVENPARLLAYLD